MKLLKYDGDPVRNVPGVGAFKKGDELPVEDHVADSFDNDTSKEQGWRVTEPPTPKKPKPKPEGGI